ADQRDQVTADGIFIGAWAMHLPRRRGGLSGFLPVFTLRLQSTRWMGERASVPGGTICAIDGSARFHLLQTHQQRRSASPAVDPEGFVWRVTCRDLLLARRHRSAFTAVEYSPSSLARCA